MKQQLNIKRCLVIQLQSTTVYTLPMECASYVTRLQRYAPPELAQLRCPGAARLVSMLCRFRDADTVLQPQQCHQEARHLWRVAQWLLTRLSHPDPSRAPPPLQGLVCARYHKDQHRWCWRCCESSIPALWGEEATCP